MKQQRTVLVTGARGLIHCEATWKRRALVQTARGMALAVWATSAVLLAAPPARAAAPVKVTAFGSNPGGLRMFKYVPDQLPASAPLITVLHGCTQNARDFGANSGWIELADRLHVALLMPEQTAANNQRNCFNWFVTTENRRDRGEPLSIKQMVDKMKSDHPVDPKRVYVTGLSAGGAMTSVMLATYPDVFAGGGIVAGLPYGCANDSSALIPTQALQCMSSGHPVSVPGPSGLPGLPLPGFQPAGIPLTPGTCLMFFCPPSSAGGGGFTAAQLGDFVAKHRIMPGLFLGSRSGTAARIRR
jgi:poly(hydroxyalkanoate) depolymerase family esterase